MSTAVGIDLGTTYSVVAHVDDEGNPVILPDEDGQPLTPSVVSFAEGAPKVGPAAKADQAAGHPAVAAFFKRNMGDPSFALHFRGRDWTPVDLSALVLSHLKAQAEARLGTPVTEAVVTVPEYFTHVQRSATIAAGQQAGLVIRRIISEPTAAALAYGFRSASRPETRSVLVYDLGGGTFDVSVVEVGPDALRVIATAGDHALGGRDFDDRLVLMLQSQLATAGGAELGEDDTGELLVEVERLKQSLSARQSAPIRLTIGGRTVNHVVHRPDFDAASADLLARTGLLADQALADAGLGWSDLDGVLPVGGSTRMPMVREWIAQASGRPPMGGINPDQAVGLGAAIQAALLPPTDMPGATPAPARERLRLTGPAQIKDVVAHSLGMITESDDRSKYLNSVILPRNKPIPSRNERPYQFDLRGDGTDTLEVFLTQGEDENPALCAYLGLYRLTGFPRGAHGQAVVDIAYAYNENAVVALTATERSSGAPLTVTVDDLPSDVPERFLGAPPQLSGRQPATIYLAFDLSGSMSGQPLQEAQKAARNFVSQIDLTTTSVGLIAFSDTVHVDCVATHNAHTIGAAIDRLSVGSTGYGNAGHPFDSLHSALHEAEGARYGIVLADGVWSGQPYAVQRAQRCHADGIEILAIGFGQADRAFLGQIASSDEKAMFTSLNNLADTFTTIARELTETAPGRSIGARLRAR